MDASETGVQKPDSVSSKLKTKKGRPMKRLKNVQKVKTVEKAIARNEKYAEKSSKIKSVADKGLKHLLHVTVKANTCLKQEEESVSLKKLRYHPRWLTRGWSIFCM
ncbi:hypothetical protein J1N35_004127 [Gossypium stocksii]|uniref:Uncharacterized protein n=1 Tax=Gossypium stocksii TaxID=47602 RepID=A0A9D3WC73_9ROSI|nr:hypothetical protein J1N35_004127 [Gossypium stocksii]